MKVYKPYVPNTTTSRDEIAFILDHQFFSTRQEGYYKFLVQWKNRPTLDLTWLQDTKL